MAMARQKYPTSLSMAPDSFVFEGFGDLGRHVVFVMLGEDRGGVEGGALEAALYNDALALTEEVGEQSLVVDEDLMVGIVDNKLNLVILLFQATFGYKATEANALVFLESFGL